MRKLGIVMAAVSAAILIAAFPLQSWFLGLSQGRRLLIMLGLCVWFTATIVFLPALKRRKSDG